MNDHDLIGEKVVSKFYGEGEIIDVFENKVEIQFAEKTVKVKSKCEKKLKLF